MSCPAVARGPKTVQIGRKQAKDYLSKAEQFLQAALRARGSAMHDAAMLSAVHAAISAADSVTVALAGVRSADPDHRRVVDLVQQVVGSGRRSERAKQLDQLIAAKNSVEYESRRATAKDADQAVKRAERVVLWAREEVERARL